MTERIDRSGDENIYQPRIHKDRIIELYKMSIETGLPMTVILDYAIRGYYRAFLEEKAKEEHLEKKLDEADNDIDHDRRNDEEFTDPWEDGSIYGF